MSVLSAAVLAWVALFAAAMVGLALHYAFKKPKPALITAADIDELMAGPIPLYQFTPIMPEPDDMSQRSDDMTAGDAGLREEIIRLQEQSKASQRETQQLRTLVQEGFKSMGEGLKEQAGAFNRTVDSIRNEFVNKGELAALAERTKRLETVIYAAIGMIVIAVFGALISQVVIK